MSSEDHLLIILHAPPQVGEDERIGRFFWRDDQGRWRQAVETGGAGDSRDPRRTAAKALQAHLEEYEDELERLEDITRRARGAADYFEVLNRLGPLVRATGNQRRALQQARELCPDDADLISHRDLADQLHGFAELIHADAKNGLDFAMACQAEEQARIGQAMAGAAHRLNCLVALFFPMATLSALFGMNLRHGLEAFDTGADPVPFFGVVGAGFLMGLILMMFITSSDES